MPDQITRKQFKELTEAYECMGDQQFVDKLKEYTGIVRKPFTVYSYYDAYGNYLGDSDDDLFDIINQAGIDIVDKVQNVKKCAVCGAPHVSVHCPVCGSGDYVEDDDEAGEGA